MAMIEPADSEHPQLVKTLGSAALAIALASVAKRMRAPT
jgi:hypothetical protein